MLTNTFVFCKHFRAALLSALPQVYTLFHWDMTISKPKWKNLGTVKKATFDPLSIKFCIDDTWKALMIRRNVKAAILRLKMELPWKHIGNQNMESSSVGFMFSNERQVSENLEIEEPVVTEGPSKKRKTKSDYLRGVKKLKATKSKRTWHWQDQ